MTLTEKQEALVRENLGLVHACAGRFRGRGADYDDLYGAGCVGLVKAAAGFDETLGYRFSTYAVPAILGEIKRIFRDGGPVKIGRTAKEKAVSLLRIAKEITDETGREASVREIAQRAGLENTDAAALLGACLPTLSLTGEEFDEVDIPVPSHESGVIRDLDLKSALEKLPPEERELLQLRYFEGLTQMKTAERLGKTQVQISRQEKKILLKLRGLME